jgi:TolA-binding protein
MRFQVAAFVVATTLLVAPAHAQVDSREGIALQNQIYQLRQELKSMQDQVSRAGPAGNRSQVYAAPPQQVGGSDLLAQLLSRVDALDEQVRQLRGRIDETQNQLQRQNDDLGKRIDDLAFQTSPQGKRPGTLRVGPSSAPPLPVDDPDQGSSPGALSTTTRPPAPPGPRTPEVALQDGNAALTRRDYAAAEAAARGVLANRTSPRAYDAQLLLAQSLAGQRQYAQAAIAFDDAYNRSRKGTHAQDALLGLASSLTAINEKKAACDTLSRLRTDFPQTRPDISAGATATAQKAGCH